MKTRLDAELLNRKLVQTRSQGESFVRMGKVLVNGRVASKTGQLVREDDKIIIAETDRYVGRAGHKLASVASELHVDFRGKVVLDVGSSTGGFTDYSLQHGAEKVIAVEIGTNQLHQSLQGNPLIELHEKTDIRNFKTKQKIDIVVADVSFMSLRDILPSVADLCSSSTQLIIMVKPQFEAKYSDFKHHGVIKNDRMRRDILKDFELWAKQHFVIRNKADSEVVGSKGNRERFYLLKKL